MEQINFPQQRKDIKTDRGHEMAVQAKLLEILGFEDEIDKISFLAANSVIIRKVLNKDPNIIETAKLEGYEKAAELLLKELNEDKEKIGIKNNSAETIH